MADFADKLGAAMAGRSQDWLAKASGLSQTTISGYLRREFQPSWDAVQKIVHALGMSYQEFEDFDPGALPPTPPVPRRGRPRKDSEAKKPKKKAGKKP